MHLDAISNTFNEQNMPEEERLKKRACPARTDRTRWRLKDNDSRRSWHYLQDDEQAKAWPQSYADKYYLNLPLDLPALPKATSALDAAKNGLTFYEKIQLPSGHWGCESGGPMIFSVGIVFAFFITETPLPAATKMELRNHVVSLAHPVDGAWGLHSTGDSTVCGTIVNYCVLRILGMEPDDPVLIKARTFIHRHGGPTHSSLWGKFWLSVLGVLDWDVLMPIPPELWLLPEWLPIAPGRLYCEMRAVYHAVSYLSSKRLAYQGNKDFISALRQELLDEPFESIMWKKHRDSVAPIDRFQPKSWVLNIATWVYTNVYEPYIRSDSLKRRAEDLVSELIDIQDQNTAYLGIAATDAPMNTIICYWRDGPDSYSFKQHIERLHEYMWMTADGMQINSTNGSQTWDTAFFIQAVCACEIQGDERWRPMLLKAYEFLDRQQVREDCVEQVKGYRQQRKGGWTFSNKDQGYVVSDCVGEALKAVILLEKTAGFPKLFKNKRLYDAVDTILLYQNSTGGVSAFEARRGGEFLDLLNPTEMFTRFMIEYDYPECTSSCVTALCLFRKYWPDYRTDDVDMFIKRAVRWLKQDQRLDGSWYGSWGICFTYAGMFALHSLASVGEYYENSTTVQRACEFLVSKQRQDGGWSESLKGCETREYHEDPKGSLVVQTAWAIIGLVEARFPDVGVIARGARFLMQRQQSNGEWLEEAVPGSFHGFCTFSYPNYKFNFTIKALGLVATRYPGIEVSKL